MTFYDSADTAAKYIDMCEGYDAAKELPVLFKALPSGAKLLEIGSGPGNDMALLCKRYDVVGSDNTQNFVNHLKQRFPENDILLLGAEALEADQKFDAIYSNKVLHHLTDSELEKSFQAQGKLLNSGGVVCHLIWKTIETIPDDFGLPFIARDSAAMQKAMGEGFELISSTPFGEFSENDSLIILARKK